MARSPKSDVVIIGLGAAGGIASYVLTKAGLNVVALEAGPRLGLADFIKALDELGSAISRNRLGGPKFNQEIPTWRPDATAPVQPPRPIVGMMNAVGGTSIHYGAQSWRLRADDFTIRSSTVAKYGEQALPTGTALVDWPLTYADLEPYYDQVEYLIGVSGKGGSNPFESPRSRDYPLPPLRGTDYLTMVEKAEQQLGYHPFPQPAAIVSEPYGKNRPACSYCGFCGFGFGCWNNAKSSTLVSAIPAAESTGRLEIRPNSRVMKLLSNDKGQVTGVQYRDDKGTLHEQPAGVVILASYVYENNRLLLLSTSQAYPQGLGNNHGQVGKYYIAQASATVNGLYPGKRFNLWGGTSGQAVLIDDLNGDNFDHTGLGFIRGASIQAATNTMPISQSAAAVPPDVPFWGSAYKHWLHDHGDSTGSLAAQIETLPYTANFIDLDPTKKDPLGVPVVRVTFNVYENEQKMAAYLSANMVKILQAAGATKTWGGALLAIAVHSHAYGGTRMGTDPASSVVNQYSLAHEASNLAVLGGSTFCSSSGYNPTETIQALSWRSADYIAQNFNNLAV